MDSSIMLLCSGVGCVLCLDINKWHVLIGIPCVMCFHHSYY